MNTMPFKGRLPAICMLIPLLLLTLATANPARAQAPQASAQVAQRLAAPEAIQAYRHYNATHSRRVQDNLRDVFRANPGFAADAALPGKPLNDAIIGPVTRKWLARFAIDYGHRPAERNFVATVLTSLERVAASARADAGWEYLGQRRGVPPAVAAVPAPVETSFSFDPKRPHQIKNLAEVLARLKPLAGQSSLPRAEFDQAVLERLEGVVKDDDILMLIERYAEVKSYLVTHELLLKLGRNGMSQQAVEDLSVLVNEEYDRLEDFEARVSGVASAEAAKDRDAIVRNFSALTKGAMVARYRIPDNLDAEIAADAPLPKPVETLFLPMKELSYPTRELFDYALEWRVTTALNMCADRHPNVSTGLDDPQFKNLAAVLPKHRDLFNEIGQLRAQGLDCKPHQLLRADALARQAYQVLSKLLNSKMDLQHTHRVTPPVAPEPSWAPADCLCARPINNGTVYALHPLWNNPARHQVDFGQLSRIGLYGMSMGEDGRLVRPNGMRRYDAPRELISAARLHSTKIDWVIDKRDWRGWSRRSIEDKRAVFRTLVRDIAELLGTRLEDRDRYGQALASLGFDPTPAMGDGVTLNFTDFPDDDKLLLNDFVVDLSKVLKAMRPARQLNLMVPLQAMTGSSTFGFLNLDWLIRHTNDVEYLSFANSRRERLDDLRVLVMLPEPTAETKKVLRGDLQNVLHGESSQRLLRNLIPVVVYDGASSLQLRDDIIYFDDNFDGIGFWTLPVAGPDDDKGDDAEDTTSINRLMTLYWRIDGDVAASWDTLTRRLCPHRLWLRWAFWGSLLVALAVGVTFLRCRGCNERLDKNGLYLAATIALIALPAVVLLILLVADPLLAPVANVMLFVYANAGVVLALLLSRYYFNKSRRRVP